MPLPRITLDPSSTLYPTRDHPHSHPHAHDLPKPLHVETHPKGKVTGTEDASIFFIGNATTVIEWEGVRIMTDPNFLHAGDHVHLGPGVTATRLQNPAVDLHDLPPIDMILLSHFHADHFDQDVEKSLRRTLPIISTPHAKECLEGSKEGKFEKVTALDHWESAIVDIKDTNAAFKITGMPGKHVPPGPAGLLEKINDFLGAVPPTNGWMVEFGAKPKTTEAETDDVDVGYRMYISGDTLLVNELDEIPKRFPDVDLMLVHLGGTTIPSPKLPLAMVTMDAEQGIKLIHLIDPEVVIPIHHGADGDEPPEYDAFLSSLDDFKAAVAKDEKLKDRVVYLKRGGKYSFKASK
ncbi:hypothetical protein YB2330_000114 [Saitoella coloradoensis]